MRLKQRVKILVNFFCCVGLVHQSFAETYTVKTGDILSQVLYEKKLQPIYGVGGSLLKVINLNSELKKQHGNKIYPGMILNLGIHPLKQSSNLKDNQTPLVNSQQTEINKFENNENLVVQPIADSVIEKSVSKKINEKKIMMTSNKKRNIASSIIASRSDLVVSGINEFISIKSVDSYSGAEATLLSDASSGFRFSWGQNWSEKFRTFLSYQSVSIAIQDTSTANKVLINTKNNVTQYQFGAEYKFSSNLKLINLLNYGESLVSRSTNSTTITVEKLIAPTISSGVEYNFYQIDNLKLKGLAVLSAVIPSKQGSYESTISFGQKFGFGLSDSIGSFIIDGECYYQNIDLKMTNVSFEQSSVGILIGIKKEFGVFD